ncbi:MAG: hypothetical protein RMY34_10565 [Aulosira sp. DedQUE10]|nr:hypothetical protein [Aulosira sp. DedQUE10]
MQIEYKTLLSPLVLITNYVAIAIKWSRRELNPNPATVRLLVSEQSNTNRGPKS